MRTLLLLTLPAMLLALGCTDSVPSGSDGAGGSANGGAGGHANGGAGGSATGGSGGHTNGGAGGSATGGSGGTPASGVRLTVESASWGGARIDGQQPQPERVFLGVFATLALAADEAPAQVAFPLFSLETAGGPIVAASALTARLPSACAADLSVAPGGQLTCPLLFEVPPAFVPAALRYQVPGGASLRALLPPLPPCTPCDRACVDLSSNPDHCGACGVELAFGQLCRDGVPSCEQAGLSVCVDRFGVSGCVDLQTDYANCGRCGRALPADSGQICVRGQATCPAGEAACAMRCIDVTTDEANCGGCGLTCPAEFSCRDGEACRIRRNLLIAQRGMTCDTFCANYPGGSCVAAEVFAWSNGAVTPLGCDALSTGRQDEQDVSCFCEAPPD